MKKVALWAWVVGLFGLGCKEPQPEPKPESRPEQPDWNLDQLTIYEVFPRQFSNSGHLNAVRTRIPELKALGVNCVWLMPVHPISEVNRNGTFGSPYAVADYRAVHPELGDLDVMRSLVDELHEAGMLCIIDWVANHTGWDHPWLTEHPDWYTHDGAGNIVSPPGTDWFDVADLNYESAELRAAMRDALRFWSEDVGVDGFRCDYAVGVPTDFWAATIAEMNAARPNSPLLWFAEAEAPSLHDAGFELTYSWQGFGSIQGVIAGSDLPESVYSSYLNEVAAIPEHCRKLRFVTNHDETSWNAPAPTMYGGVAAMQCAQAITAFLPGVPLVYNGQEVGCNQVLHLFEDVPIDWSTHPELRAWYTSLLTTRAQHEAFQGTALSFHPAENLFVAERVDGTGTARALLVVNVRDFAQDFNFAAWTASDWTEAFTGNAMPATSNLGPFAIRLYVR